MTSKDLTINAIFTLLCLTIFFIIGKLLLFCASFGFTIDQQTNNIATATFLFAGALSAMIVIYKNRQV